MEAEPKAKLPAGKRLPPYSPLLRNFPARALARMTCINSMVQVRNKHDHTWMTQQCLSRVAKATAYTVYKDRLACVEHVSKCYAMGFAPDHTIRQKINGSCLTYHSPQKALFWYTFTERFQRQKIVRLLLKVKRSWVPRLHLCLHPELLIQQILHI